MKSAAAEKRGGSRLRFFRYICRRNEETFFRDTPLSAIVAPLLAVGCNDGVFIDDFLPEAPSVTVGPDDTSATIRFEAGNWDILSVEGPTTCSAATSTMRREISSTATIRSTATVCSA